MTDMRRLIATMVFLTVTVVGINLFSATPAYACSCTGDPFGSVEEADVDLAFIGTVTDERVVLLGLGDTIWTFEVEEVLVGEIGPTVRVRAPSDSAACGLWAYEGKKMAVIAYKQGRLWTTDACSTGHPVQALGFGEAHPPDPTITATPKYSNSEVASLAAVVTAIGATAGLSVFGLRRLRTKRAD